MRHPSGTFERCQWFSHFLPNLHLVIEAYEKCPKIPAEGATRKEKVELKLFDTEKRESVKKRAKMKNSKNQVLETGGKPFPLPDSRSEEIEFPHFIILFDTRSSCKSAEAGIFSAGKTIHFYGRE